MEIGFSARRAVKVKIGDGGSSLSVKLAVNFAEMRWLSARFT